jgi:CheY-like chemotaxis protein
MPFIKHDSPRILIVEDDIRVRAMGVDLLEVAGFEVRAAATADEAIAILKDASDVKLVFADVEMPGSMNGLQLADFVHQRWPDIRLLLTSGHYEPHELQISKGDLFLPKPYSIVTVVNAIDELLEADPS